MPTAHTSHAEVDCIVCAEPCSVLAVFRNCGHFVCFTCGLRIHTFNNNKGCPICREKSEAVIVTRKAPESDDGFDVDRELGFLVSPVSGGSAVKDEFLKCIIDGVQLAEHIRKLYEFVCPIAGCWNKGHQEPFVRIEMLKEHLQVDHKLRYCPTCLKHKPAFQCEQTAYDAKEYDNHLQGVCSHLDSPSFQGHPPCKFCSNERFYDGEYLLKHMQENHFSCDFCNRGEFTFTYYKNRAKLIEHFERVHKLCDHPACASQDPMLRVFASDIDLQMHKQKEHGIGTRSGVSLQAFGFRFSYGSGGEPAGSGAPMPPSTSGANSHALVITFDHVNRREEVNTMPKSAGERGGRRKPKPSSAAADSEAGGRTRHGLPPHFVDPKLHLTTIRVDTSGHHHHRPPATASSSSPTNKVGSWGSMRAPESVPAETGSTALAGLSKQELNDRFEIKVNLFLQNQRALAEFRFACSDFIAGKLLAKEFHDQLANRFFTNSDQFETVFPLLVATIPVEAKRDALRQVRQMLTAPEIQRLQRANEDEDKTQVQQVGTGRSLVVKKKQVSAWTKPTGSSKPAPSGSPISSSAASFPAAEARGPRWGGPGQAAPPALSPAHVDPGEFPELPGAMSTRARYSANPARPPLKNNAWFASKK